MTLNRRSFQQALAATLAGTTSGTTTGIITGSLTGAAHAQAGWPNKPIRYIVPFAPGGTIGGGTISSHAINATLYDKLPYDPVTSFAPITLLPPSPTCCWCTPRFRHTTCAS